MWPLVGVTKRTDYRFPLIYKYQAPLKFYVFDRTLRALYFQRVLSAGGKPARYAIRSSILKELLPALKRPLPSPRGEGNFMRTAKVRVTEFIVSGSALQKSSRRRSTAGLFGYGLLARLCAASGASAQWVTATVAAGSQPQAVAVNPVTNKIYVANFKGNSVTVIDGATNATVTVTVGSQPQGVAVNPATNKIYVSNFNSNSVTIIDGVTNTPTSVAAGINPGGIAINAVTNKIYVVNGGSNNVTVIDGATGTTTTIAAGSSPYAVAVNTVTNKIYVANLNVANVTVIDGATSTTATVPVGNTPAAVAVNPVTNKIYVSNFNGSSVT